jgi:serine/threonine protein kinase
MPLEDLELGKYRLIRLIGSGGMGDVYLGEDAGINRQVAIKVMRADVASYPNDNLSKKSERLFQREMRAVAMLDHPHILPLYDYGEKMLHTTALLYMVMPFRQEGSLADWLRQRSSEKPLQLQEITYFLSQAADALQHAHDHQIIHQDVKPSNFLLRGKRDPSMQPDLLLADFGIAKISTLTSSLSQSSRGTPLYMAPEQWIGDPVPETDQYALAVMLYELLIGCPPFRGRPEQLMYLHINTPPPAPTSLNTSLPSGMDTVLLRALAKKPAERFPSVIDFAQAFQQALQVSSNLQATLAISRTEASTGTQRELTLPGGRKIQVTVPPGVQDGHVLYLEGMSDPPYAGGPRGSLALTVIISSQERLVLSEGASDKTVRSKDGNIPPSIPVSSPSQSSPQSALVKSIKREKSEPKGKREWIEQGVSMGITLVVLFFLIINSLVGWNVVVVVVTAILGVIIVAALSREPL